MMNKKLIALLIAIAAVQVISADGIIENTGMAIGDAVRGTGEAARDVVYTTGEATGDVARRTGEAARDVVYTTGEATGRVARDTGRVVTAPVRGFFGGRNESRRDRKAREAREREEARYQE